MIAKQTIYPADLHLHTCFSDGRAQPEEVLKHAAEIGIKILAITDHDNLKGMDLALPISARYGLKLVPGIEFTCRWDHCGGVRGSIARDVDVLGYGFDPGDSSFRATVHGALEDMFSRIDSCCQLLTDNGYPISLTDAFSINPNYAGAMAVIDALVGKGLVADWNAGVAVFNRFWSRIRPGKLSLKQAIAAIHAAGGVAVLAHPSLVRCGNSSHASNHWLGEQAVWRLVKMGLDGIEVFHYRLNPEARQHFLELSVKFRLAVSGGSDEHGWPSGFARMGLQPVTEEMVHNLLSRGRNIANHSSPGNVI